MMTSPQSTTTQNHLLGLYEFSKCVSRHDLLYEIKQLCAESKGHKWTINWRGRANKGRPLMGVIRVCATNGVTHGSIFRLVLFIIHVNGTNVGIKYCIYKFANDAE